ncbi:hypothetical protein Bhyg_03653 [Pseudolycoriella hygida]|uniref:Uncharacterized protein n=1 Tax=Pseudolycoriella hygida TaxID=35572 RepID=A0A9Q0S9I9_9DIPT|nr:hypothetical protein Bhyg_03653 [Pseudolycoriella hygida]
MPDPDNYDDEAQFCIPFVGDSE